MWGNCNVPFVFVLHNKHVHAFIVSQAHHFIKYIQLLLNGGTERKETIKGYQKVCL